VAPNANPPVCRIMDYGTFKFDAAQRAKESRRKTSSVTLKEMKYRVKIGQGDFDTKTRKVIHFLDEGHKVKITIMFRGRETAHPHLGKEILDRIAERAIDTAKVESAPKLDGRNMIMVLAPDKRAQAAARANKAQAGEPAAPGSANGSSTTTGEATDALDATEAPAVATPSPEPEQQTQE
jgi:translation initiation factor IF-3